MWERSSSAYSLVGLRNNKVFTYFMDTSNSANDVGLDVAPSVSISTSYDLWDFSKKDDSHGWLACVLLDGDIYAFYLNITAHIPEVEHAYYFENNSTSTPTSISVAFGDPDQVFIFLSSVSVPGQQYADRIKFIRLSQALTGNSYILQKEILTNTIGSIIALSDHDDSILIASTRHYESESPTLNSAQLFRMTPDFDTSEFSPSGAVQVYPFQSYSHSSLKSFVTNDVLADLDTLRSNAFHSKLDNVTFLDRDSAVITEEMKVTEEGFQTIQPLVFWLDSSYSFGASVTSNPKHLGYNVRHWQGLPWQIIEAKVGGEDVPWVSTRTTDTFFIDPSLATGEGVCWGIEHILDLKFELDTLGKLIFLLLGLNISIGS